MSEITDEKVDAEKKEKEFIHLHVHTEYSLLDGIARIDGLVETAKKRGYRAVAMTDHGNMYGALKFYKKCLTLGIKPIIGTEFYIVDDLTDKEKKVSPNHLILLAKNNEGYQNLLKLNSIAFVDGFYYKPRIDYKVLAEHSKGLICLSACLAGIIPRCLLKGDYNEALRYAKLMKGMFDEGDFYIELQNHNLPEQIAILKDLNRLAKEIGVKTVATNDAHYLTKEDAEVQDVLLCVQMGKKIDDPDRMRFESNEFYLKTYDEMLEALSNYPEALETTIEIADKCDVVIRSKAHAELGVHVDDKYILPATENFIPPYEPEDGSTQIQYLRKLTEVGLKRRYKDKLNQRILDRASEELQIIEDLGFAGYFLVVRDYVIWSKNNGVPVGPGRGSGAGSVVAYAVDIVDIEPLKYDLLFERFIHKERVSMPDFDIDFDPEGREDVIEYTRRKYGAENVSLIVTFGTMAAKNAIRDVARVFGMPFSEVDKITKLIPNKLPEGIKHPPVLAHYFGLTGKPENEKYVIPELQAFYNSDPQIAKIINLAVKLEGAPRQTSMHAAGVLIAPKPVSEFVPLAKNGDVVTTQYDMIELEGLGLLKMDFLGLRTLTDINKALSYIKKSRGKDIDILEIDYDDQNVYNLIGSGDTDAIFQLESAGFKKFMRELRPTCLEDIVAGVALFRPGPMDSIPTYVENKHNPEKIKYDDPCLEPILNVTYGCIVYQEQVMRICQVMGGYSLGQADNVRRIMSKKKKDKMALEREKFINGWVDPEGKKSIPGAIKLGIPKEAAETVFSKMESFASYAFNKSHSVAYAYVTYQTAFLRCYYEVEFLCAVLNNRINNSDELKTYIAYAKKKKIEILPPSVNKSDVFFSVENGNLRYGLSGLKGVGVGLVTEIIDERDKNGQFKDLEDFIERVDEKAMNKKCIEGFILSGAFDEFGKTRSSLMAVYEQIVQRVKNDKKQQATGQESMFGMLGNDNCASKINYPDMPEYIKTTKLKFEKEVLGTYLSGHPLDDFIDEINGFSHSSADFRPMETDVDDIDDGEEKEVVYSVKNGETVKSGGVIATVKRILTKDGQEMLAGEIEDLSGKVEFICFPKVVLAVKDLIKVENVVKFTGRVSLRGNNPPSIAIDSLELMQKEVTKHADIPNVVVKKERLVIRYDVNNEELNNKVNSFLRYHGGDLDVFVVNIADGKSYKSAFKVSKSKNLEMQLEGLIGAENLVWQ